MLSHILIMGTVLSIITVSFSTYWLLYFFLIKKGPITLRKTYFLRISGFILFGIIPSLFNEWWGSSPIDILSFDIKTSQMCWIVCITSPLILLANYLLSKKSKHQKEYPATRQKTWTCTDLIINGFTWILYLFGYEALLRGLFFFSLLEITTPTITITANVLVYAIIHIPKGKFEVLGSIPLGIVFCIITLITNTFYTVFILHCIMAISNDLFCIRNNPAMSVVTSS